MRWFSLGKIEIAVSRERVMIAMVGGRISRVLLDATTWQVVGATLAVFGGIMALCLAASWFIDLDR